MEETLDNIGFFIPNHFKCSVIQGCNCRANGHDRNTAYQKYNVQDHQIRDPPHKTEERVFHIEKATHSLLSPFCKQYTEFYPKRQPICAWEQKIRVF